MWNRIFGIIKVLVTGAAAAFSAHQAGAPITGAIITGAVTAVTAVAPLMHDNGK